MRRSTKPSIGFPTRRCEHRPYLRPAYRRRENRRPAPALQNSAECRPFCGGRTKVEDHTPSVDSPAKSDTDKNAVRAEEHVDVEVLRARMNPKNPTTREKQEHVDSGHVLCRNWCPPLSWLPRFAAQFMKKMRIGNDGKNERNEMNWMKMERANGTIWRGSLVP